MLDYSYRPMVHLVAFGCALATGGCGRNAGHGVVAGYTKIDDMEGTGATIEWAPPPGMTSGFWWSATDCTQADRILPLPYFADPLAWAYAPLPEPESTMPGVTSTHAARLRTTAPLVRVWGANMGIDLAEQPDADGGTLWPPTPGVDAGAHVEGQPCEQGSSRRFSGGPVDLRSYTGVTFWGMSSGSSEQVIRVQLNDRNTDPRGGVCNAVDRNDESQCYNGFGTELLLTNVFTQYRVDFSALQQSPTWGYHPDPAVLDLLHVYLMNFEVDLPSCTATSSTKCAGGQSSLAFDFWIDDLYFVNAP